MYILSSIPAMNVVNLISPSPNYITDANAWLIAKVLAKQVTESLAVTWSGQGSSQLCAKNTVVLLSSGLTWNNSRANHGFPRDRPRWSWCMNRERINNQYSAFEESRENRSVIRIREISRNDKRSRKLDKSTQNVTEFTKVEKIIIKHYLEFYK